MTLTPAPERVVQRLFSKIEVDENGCWISLYSTGSHGYSQIGWTDKDTGTTMRVGHRVAWESVHGPIPDGQTVEHICRVRRCINPEHLMLMGNIENARGGGGRHDGVPEDTGRLCGKGLHPLLRYPSGAVACRECQRNRAKRKYPGRVAARKARRV